MITVDPAATTRVREIMARLSPLPNPVPDAGRPGRGDRAGGRGGAPGATRRWPRSGGRSTPTARRSASGCRTWSSGSRCCVLASPLLAAGRAGGAPGQPGPIFFRQQPARVQQRGDPGAEVPHHAARGRRRPGGTAGHRGRRPGHPGRADPAQDQRGRAAAAAERDPRRDVAGRAAPARHRDEDRRGAVRPAGRRVRAPAPDQARADRLGRGERLPRARCTARPT